jgi:hypothetical protein
MVSHHDPLPADGLTVRWDTWDGEHSEELTLRWENEAWTATGMVARERIQYVVRLSPMWQVRQFLLFRDLDEPDLWLGTDGNGRWGEMNGAHRPDLDGALDITLGCTPFDHLAPLRRAGNEDQVSVSTLLIDVETLGVVTSGRAYHRIGDRRWEVDDGERRTAFAVDRYGLALDIEDAFRRR